jgi:O-antigen/teichoic acid export membrane protein
VAHRVLAAALLVAAIVLLPTTPLLAVVPLGASLAIFLNGRGAFGSGMYRAILAFVSALWLTLVGVVATLLGLIPAGPGGNFLLVPGLTMLAAAAALFLGSLVAMWRARRYRARWPGEVSGRRRR